MKTHLIHLLPRAVIVTSGLALFLAASPSALHAQAWARCLTGGISEEAAERWRLSRPGHACGDSSEFPLLRSVSSQVRGSGLIWPAIMVVSNSALPFSMNDGALWAGKGVSTRLTAGAHVELGRLRVVLMPEYLRSENAHWELRDTVRFWAPPIPEERRGGGYVFPWYVKPNSIDLPLRFGDEGLGRLAPGQSSAMLSFGSLLLGASTENHWWGPGVHNALVLSNNAAGFPHLMLRTDRPLQTRWGTVEGRWLVGGLTESDYFDTTSTNDLRSLSAFALTIRPARAPNLTFGLARSVMESAAGWEDIPLRWLSVLKGARRASDDAGPDSLAGPHREQIVSLFVRWVMPEAGLETYGEWGRTELPESLRDFLVAPNHTQGYTLGFQWARPVLARSALFRMRGEATTIEQSATFRDRPLGVWYTSRRLPQGYTNGGQSIGAAIAPGASNQWLAFDYFTDKSSTGIYFGRIRWHEDIRSLYPWPAYQLWCNHDVSLLWGLRGSRRTPIGDLSVDAAFGNRINAFFQVQSGCPRGDSMRDIRNNTLRVSFTPFRRK